MEITFFLVIERIKGDQSFFKPFLDSLPEANESLFNLDPNKTIYGQQGGEGTLLLDEIQNSEDIVLSWSAYNQNNINKCKLNFEKVISEKFNQLQEWLGEDGIEL